MRYIYRICKIILFYLYFQLTKLRHRSIVLCPGHTAGKQWIPNSKSGISLWNPMALTTMLQRDKTTFKVQGWIHSLWICWFSGPLGQRWAHVLLPQYPKFKVCGDDIIMPSNHSVSWYKWHNLFSEEKSTATSLAGDFWCLLLATRYFPFLSPVLAPHLDYKFSVN